MKYDLYEDWYDNGPGSESFKRSIRQDMLPKKEKVYTFVEPHFTGGDCTVTITESKILKYMKKKQKMNSKMKDASDKDLIDDFIVVNWCSEVKDKI